VPAALAAFTITLDYNNSEQVEKVFKEIGDSIGAWIGRTCAGNMMRPADYRDSWRRCASVDRHGTVLIFDEV